MIRTLHIAGGYAVLADGVAIEFSDRRHVATRMARFYSASPQRLQQQIAMGGFIANDTTAAPRRTA